MSGTNAIINRTKVLTALYLKKIEEESQKKNKKKTKTTVNQLIQVINIGCDKISSKNKNRTYICSKLKERLKLLAHKDEERINQITGQKKEEYIDKVINIIADYEAKSSFNIPEEEFAEVIKRYENNEIKWTTVFSLAHSNYLTGKAKEEIKETVIDNPYIVADDALNNLEFERKYHIHVGLTNTGKTYAGMQALKSAKTGVYLSPLRLLALEKQEELNKAGCICSMITGEEESILPFATHMSSTIELMDTMAEYDVAVIDECQMISDKNRGQFWTKAILEIKAHDIYLCMAPEALNLIKRILSEAKLSFDIIEHERNTPLILEKKPYCIPSSIKKGDALIVFSRRQVLNLAQDLRQDGYKVSTIYGALPYSTRKMQIEEFTSGKTDIIIATDAIGMGLNLPIKRIVFVQSEKYDGERVRELTPSEIRQIAGRAGRYGIFPTGYVAATSKEMIFAVDNALSQPIKDLTTAYVGYSKDIIEVNDNLFKTISLWKEISTIEPFVKIDISRIKEREIYLSDFMSKLSKDELFKLLRIPFNEKLDTVGQLFVKYIAFYISTREYLEKYPIELEFPSLQGKTLYDYETYYACLDLFYSFSKNFNYKINQNKLTQEKEKTAKTINSLLISNNSSITKKCVRCHQPLPNNFKYTICDKCFKHSRKKPF